MFKVFTKDFYGVGHLQDLPYDLELAGKITGILRPNLDTM